MEPRIHADTAHVRRSNRLACDDAHHAVILARSRSALQFRCRRAHRQVLGQQINVVEVRPSSSRVHRVTRIVGFGGIAFLAEEGSLLLDHGSLLEIMVVREIFSARPTKKTLYLNSAIEAAIGPRHLGALGTSAH